MGQRFTEWQRQKLVKLGFVSTGLHSMTNIVIDGYGKCSKKVGNVQLTLNIVNHEIHNYSLTFVCTDNNISKCYDIATDMNSVAPLLKKLKYFK